MMTSIKTIVAAALLLAMATTPVLAQAAVQEPGMFAFYHPNLDVLNGGAPTPAARLASQPEALEAYAARESGQAAARDRSCGSYARASGTFRGRYGRRHPVE